MKVMTPISTSRPMISLVMRNPRDTTEDKGEHITRLAELGPPVPEPPPKPEPVKAEPKPEAAKAPEKAPEPAKPVEPPKRSVVLLRGGESTTLWFPLPEPASGPRTGGGSN